MKVDNFLAFLQRIHSYENFGNYFLKLDRWFHDHRGDYTNHRWFAVSDALQYWIRHHISHAVEQPSRVVTRPKLFAVISLNCLKERTTFSGCSLLQFSAAPPQQLYFRRKKIGELSNLFSFVFTLDFGIGLTSIVLGCHGSNRSYSSCSSSSSSYCLILCLV